MKKKILTALPFILIAATVGAAFPQTRCVWIEKIEGDKGTQRIGLSARVVKLFATPGANFDLNGMRLTFDTLLIVAKNGSTITLKDSTGNGETVIRGGKFNERMDQETPRHNHLIVEESDSGEPPRISKLRVESVEAVGVLLLMNHLDGSKEPSKLPGFLA